MTRAKHPRMIRRPITAVLIALVLAACSNDKVPTADGGSADANPLPDGGGSTDSGASTDASNSDGAIASNDASSTGDAGGSHDGAAPADAASALDASSGTDAALGGDAAQVSDAGECTQSGTATLSGTFLGITLSPKDAVAFPTGTSSAMIIIADFPHLCSFVGNNNAKANSNVLTLDFLSKPLAVGSFGAGTDVSAQYAQFDATCVTGQGESATSGTVTITAMDATNVTGTFDLTLNTDHVTGTFTAPLFPTQSSSSAPTVCE